MSDERTKDIHLQVCMKIAAENINLFQPEIAGSSDDFVKGVMGLTQKLYTNYENLSAKLTQGSVATSPAQAQPAYQEPVQKAADNADAPRKASDSACKKCGEAVDWHKVDGKNVPKNMDGTAHWDTCTGANQMDPNGPKWNVGKGTCNKCQADIWWKEKRDKTGSYPINADSSYHSETCGGHQPIAQGTAPEPFDIEDMENIPF